MGLRHFHTRTQCTVLSIPLAQPQLEAQYVKPGASIPAGPSSKGRGPRIGWGLSFGFSPQCLIAGCLWLPGAERVSPLPAGVGGNWLVWCGQ